MNRETAEELYQFVKSVDHPEECAVFNSPASSPNSGVKSGPCTCGKTKAEDVLYRFATQK